MILMVNGAHHDESHQKQKLRQKKNNRYEGISLVENGFCAFYPCGDTLRNCRPATEADTDFNVFILDESDIDDVALNAYVKELADKSVCHWY
jgi:hypothetical protein